MSAEGVAATGRGAGRERSAEVLVVGAGPVGLFLAGLLAARGVDVAVLERRERPPGHSRAIGLHPPALDALAPLGLVDAAVAAGTIVRSGVGYGDGRLLGRLTFEGVHPRHPFVLTLPQTATERLLAGRLEELAPGALHRGVEVVEVVGMEVVGEPVRVTARTVAGESVRWAAGVVVAADGAHSRVRELAGIGVDRREWGDSYLMGDFADEPAAVPRDGAVAVPGDGTAGEAGSAPTAVIHLHRDGVVESFPLPGGQRRWVVHTGRTRHPERAEDLVALVAERLAGGDTGPVPLPQAGTATMVSAFTVYRQLARRMVSGRIVLVGDAAHAISPIGGQGMTLGWLDALELAPLLDRSAVSPLDRPAALADVERGRLRAARTAARQAEVNMLLGRALPRAACTVRDWTARGVVATPLRHQLARLYTMGWAG